MVPGNLPDGRRSLIHIRTNYINEILRSCAFVPRDQPFPVSFRSVLTFDYSFSSLKFEDIAFGPHPFILDLLCWYVGADS